MAVYVGNQVGNYVYDGGLYGGRKGWSKGMAPQLREVKGEAIDAVAARVQLGFV